MEPESAHPAPSRVRLWIAFASIYLVWGSTYLAIRFAIETVPPLSMAGVRYLVAGAALVIWQRARGAPWPRALQWREAAIVGGLMLLGGNGGVCWAEQIVPSGVTALFISTVPIWIVLLDWLWLGNIRPSPQIVLGLALGIGGVALLVRTSGAPGGAAPPLGAAILVLASGSWAA
ncbi:MAG TPA: EamA family transporter, partial [Candidatus Angelobacter sp.]|nr:EamA family transporter [Candidatus Angelobacter sp.]